MSLPLYLAPPEQLAAARVGGRFVLAGPEGRHAATVRRTEAGERLRVADGLGTVLTGLVLAAEGEEVELTVETVEQEPEPSLRFVLVQALAKNDRDEAAIEQATELGVDEVVPWQAARSIVRWRGDREEKARRKWEAVLTAATKQSRRARRPVLGATARTADLVTRIEAGAAAYVLHEEATEPLAGVRLPGSGEVLVVVGPEGGIGPEEIEALAAAGAQVVRLGETVLRSSSAGPAALAVLSAASRWR